MNLRLLRLTAFVISDVGLILLAMAFLLRLGLGSIVTLIAAVLMGAGIWLILAWNWLTTKKSKN